MKQTKPNLRSLLSSLNQQQPNSNRTAHIDEHSLLPPLSAHDIIAHLREQLGETLYLVDPHYSINNSPISSIQKRAQRGTVTLLQLLGALTHNRDERPIIAILNTTDCTDDISTAYATTPLPIETRTDCHWIAAVYLPAEYQLDEDWVISNKRAQWIFIDPLPNREIPKSLVNALKKGMSVTALDSNNQIKRIEIPALFASAKPLNFQNVPLQSTTQDNTSGYWAIYNSMMLVLNGNADYLERFTSRDPYFPYQIKEALDRPSNKLSRFYSLDQVKEILDNQPILREEAQNKTLSIELTDTLSAQVLLDGLDNHLQATELTPSPSSTICYWVEFKDGGARPLIITFEDVDEQILDEIREAYFITKKTNENPELLGQLYRQVKATLLAADNKPNIKIPLQSVLSTLSSEPIDPKINPLAIKQADIPLSAGLLIELTLSTLFDSNKASAHSTNDTASNYSSTNANHRLWIDCFITEWKENQNQQKNTHFTTTEEIMHQQFDTLSKLILTNQQLERVNLETMDLYELNKTKSIIANMLALPIATTIDDQQKTIENVLASCAPELIKKLIIAQKNHEQLNLILKQLVEKVERPFRTEIDKIDEITQQKSTHYDQGIYAIKTARDALLLGSMLQPIGMLFESSVGYCHPIIDFAAEQTLNAALFTLPNMRSRAKPILKRALSKDNVKTIAKYAGFGVGALLSLNNGIYFATRSLLISSLTLTYHQANQPKIDLARAGYITQPKNHRPSTINFYRLMLLISAIGQSIYYEDPQSLINFVGAISMSMAIVKCFQAISPKPTSSEEQQDNQNAAFVLSILGHFLGQRLIGYIAYNYSRIRICKNATNIFKDNFDTGTSTITSAECSDHPLTLRFWEHAPLKVTVKSKDGFNNAYNNECQISSTDPGSFFNRKLGLECGTPNQAESADPEIILALPAPRS